MAAHCSRTERRAENAERELTKVKVLTLLEKHVGEEYSGIVAAVAEYGLFVAIPKYLIEGLIHVGSLRDDSYEFDARNYALVGRKSGRKVRVGDTLRVVIAAVDIPRRELDLAPALGTVFAEPGRQTAQAAPKVTGKASGRKPGRGKDKRKGRRRR